MAGTTLIANPTDFIVARITVSGALDVTFDNDGKQTVAFGSSHDVAYGIAVDSADRIVVAGYSEAGGQVRPSLV